MNTNRFLGMAVLCVLSSWGCRGEQSAVEEKPEAAPTVGPTEIVDLLPAENAVSGWSQEGEPRFFGPDNLWEFIDGAAEGYLAYGFEEVVTADYVQAPTERQAVIDIYRMQDAVHAFGIYGQERSPDYEFLDIGAEGYLSRTALNFWRGPYYVKLTVFEESDELKNELRKLAADMSAKIVQPAVPPPEVRYFPAENQVPRSIQYIPWDVLGQSYLSNGFEARYKMGEQELKAVAIIKPDTDAAVDALTKYKQFVSSANPDVAELAGVGEEGFIGKDNYYGIVLAVRAANRILVVLGASSESEGKELLSQMLALIQSGG